MYQLKNEIINSVMVGESVIRLNADGSITSFGQDPDNTDYANFKKDLADGAELQDAEGNTMTTEQINEFIKELP